MRVTEAEEEAVAALDLGIAPGAAMTDAPERLAGDPAAAARSHPKAGREGG
mgnify:FL=1